MRTNQCLILAAGNGRRLLPHSNGLPKPLVKLRGVPLLQHVMLDAHDAGIERFVVVVGYRGESIRRWFAGSPLRGLDVTWIENTDYNKNNGISALKAKDELCDPFLLLMADHIFEAQTARALLKQPLTRAEIILAVDHKIDRVFDLDDATKVRREGDHIVDIGKDITGYDALDTGMFLCSPTLFTTLESAMVDGNCSLSDGMRKLAQERSFQAFDIGDAHWQDVDTPEALAHAERTFHRDFCRSCKAKELAVA